MADYTRRLKKVLSDHGCYFVRHGKGDHDTWFSPINKTNFTVDGAINDRHMANAVLKQAGISHKF